MSQFVFPSHYQAMGFEKITVSSTAIGGTTSEFSPKIPNARKAHAAVVSVEGTAGTNDVRWTVDGTTPTSSTGHLLKAGNELVVLGLGNITNLRMIRTSSDATVHVTYF